MDGPMSIVERTEPAKREKRTRSAPTSAAASYDDEVQRLKTALQQQRRQTTLLKAELHKEMERRELLEHRLQPIETQLRHARVAATASRTRRKEMARVIAARDARIAKLEMALRGRDEQIATLARAGSIKRLFARLSGRKRTD